MISSVSASCTDASPDNGKCCAENPGKGVSTCTAGVATTVVGAPTAC